MAQTYLQLMNLIDPRLLEWARAAALPGRETAALNETLRLLTEALRQPHRASPCAGIGTSPSDNGGRGHKASDNVTGFHGRRSAAIQADIVSLKSKYGGAGDLRTFRGDNVTSAKRGNSTLYTINTKPF